MRRIQNPKQLITTNVGKSEKMLTHIYFRLTKRWLELTFFYLFSKTIRECVASRKLGKVLLVMTLFVRM